MRSAEGRRVPFAKGQGDAHVGGDAPHGVLGTGRHSALRPLGFAEGVKTRLATAETRRPAAGPSYAADDFAWLFDIVNRMSARLGNSRPTHPRHGRDKRGHDGAEYVSASCVTALRRHLAGTTSE